MAIFKKLTFLLSILCLTPTLASAGVRDGAGGDGVYVGGKLVLRDFLQSASPDLVGDNVAFAKSVPDFLPLIREIAAAQPGLALALLKQLSNAKIWTTDQSLPLLPASETTLVGPDAEVQIASRFDENIVISLPAFRKVQGSYVLVHEALHGIIPGDGPIHHVFVREIVGYLHENRGKVDPQELSTLLENAGAQTYADSSPLANPILRVLLLGDQSDPLTCADFAFAKDVNTSFNVFITLSTDVAETVGAWRDFSQCAGDAHFKYLRKAAPGLYQLINLNPTIDVMPFIDEVGNKPGFFASSWERDNYAVECKDYGSLAMKKELDDVSREIQNALSVTSQAKAEIEQAKRSQDPSAIFIQAMATADVVPESDGQCYYFAPANIGSFEEALRAQVEKLASKRATYEKNAALCK